MKLPALAVATVFALSGTAFAQNGLDLGSSMPGTKAGVPYPRPMVTGGAAPQYGTAAPRHRKHFGHATRHHHPKKKRPGHTG
jgi:hypothetical protein